MSVLLEHAPIAVARKNVTVCVLDDDPQQLELSARLLERSGFPVVGATSPQETLQRIRLGGFRVVVADLKRPGMDGLTFLEKSLQCDPGMYVILVTESYSVDCAIEAIKRGAYDY